MTADPIPLRTEELLAHAGWLRALARSLVSDSAAADDLVQDTWVAALRHPPDTDRPLRPWLARVVRNLARNRRRGEAHRSQRESVERPSAGPIAPADIAAEVEAQRTLAEAVLALEEPLRTTVVLRYFRGMNASEIAAAQHVPAGTVRWRLKRAIDSLRNDLDRRFGGRRESWCVALAALVPRESVALSASSVSTGVSIMSTSTKVGVAAALALCIGVGTWLAVDITNGPEFEMDPFGNVYDVFGNPIASPGPAIPVDPPTETVERQRVATSVQPSSLATQASSATELVPLAPKDCCIVGRVVDAAGRPIPDALTVALTVRVEEKGLIDDYRESNERERAKTDHDGVFELPVAAATPYAVVAELGRTTRAVSPCFAGEVIEVVLTEGATMTVRVISRHTSARGVVETPVEGAFVSAWARIQHGSLPYWHATGTSDAAGEIVLPRVPLGLLEIRTKKDGLVRSESGAMSPGEGAFSHEVALAVPSALEGVVIDRKSRLPLPDARVVVNGDEGVPTDADGRYRLASFAPGPATNSVGASADGYAPSYAYVRFDSSDETKQIDFELDPAERVRGRVVDENRNPILRARISYSARLSTEPFVGETPGYTTESVADGSFELRNLVAETIYRVAITSSGHGARVLTIGPLASGTAITDVGDIELTPPSSIAGRVEGPPQDRAPLIRLHVASGPDDNRSRIASTRPDPQGRFVFESLGADRYRLELVLPSPTGEHGDERIVATRTIELAAGESKAGCDLFATSLELRGRVVGADGSSLSGCRVLVYAAESATDPIASTRTDDGGRFRVPVEVDGPLRVVVEDPRLFYDTKSVDSIHAGGDEIVIALDAFRSPFVIRGRVLDTSGKAPERVYIAFTDTTTNQRLGRVAMPDESGRFEMKDLRDVAYDLELVDFGDLYKPAKIPNVRPSGGDVVLEIQRRE